MKRAWLFIILLAVSASAQTFDSLTQNIDVLVNNDTLPPDLTVGSQDSASFKIYVPPGSEIEGVTVDSDNLFFKYGMEALLTEQIIQSQFSGEKEVAVQVPLPPGEGDVAVSVDYVGENLDDKKEEFRTHLTVEGDDKLLGTFIGLLSDEAIADLAGELGAIRLLPRDDKLTYRDLRKEDIDKLGVSVTEFYEAKRKVAQKLVDVSQADLPQIEEIAEKEQKYNLNDVQDLFKDYAKELKGKIHPDVVVKTHVYKIKIGDKEITKSKIHISILADEALSKINIVALIPKEIASTASFADFSEQPIVLKDDPVVKWAFKNIPQDQHKDYTFTVDGDAQNFDTIAVAAAKKPSWLARFIAWIISKLKS